MKDITDKEFRMFRDYIKSNYGISLGDEKKSLVYSRLRSTLQELGFGNFTQYYDYLVGEKSQEAVIHFIDKITTNHTFFMREIEHFNYFRDIVLPYIERTYYRQKDVRLWCAGCSSGEEAYTLQMIMKDFFADKNSDWNTELLATDISANILDKAIQGVYSADSVKVLSKGWIQKYFKKLDSEHYVVCDEIKKDITYRKFNLMDEKFPFKKHFQVVFCRNVMIYFDNETRNRLVQQFYHATERDGYLFIGHSESLNHTDTKYKYIMPAVYRKI